MSTVSAVEPEVQSLAPMALKKVCVLEDWNDPRRRAAMRRVLPYFVEMNANYPEGMEHRKHWEFAQLMVGIDQLNALPSDGLVLSVGAGHEEPVFELTNRSRWVFATDIYGEGSFKRLEGSARMLSDPDSFARVPYRRGRLVTQWMNALDLRYEDNTFDVVFSLSSIEHFGKFETISKALNEMVRVLKGGGILMVATECIVNGADDHWGRGIAVFTPATIQKLADSVVGAALVEPIDFGVDELTARSAQSLKEALKGRTKHPAIVFSNWGRDWTSVSLFFRKAGSPALP